MENMSMFHNMNGHKKSTENFSKIHFGIQVKNIKKSLPLCICVPKYILGTVFLSFGRYM